MAWRGHSPMNYSSYKKYQIIDDKIKRRKYDEKYVSHEEKKHNSGPIFDKFNLKTSQKEAIRDLTEPKHLDEDKFGTFDSLNSRIPHRGAYGNQESKFDVRSTFVTPKSVELMGNFRERKRLAKDKVSIHEAASINAQRVSYLSEENTRNYATKFSRTSSKTNHKRVGKHSREKHKYGVKTNFTKSNFKGRALEHLGNDIFSFPEETNCMHDRFFKTSSRTSFRVTQLGEFGRHRFGPQTKVDCCQTTPNHRDVFTRSDRYKNRPQTPGPCNKREEQYYNQYGDQSTQSSGNRAKDQSHYEFGNHCGKSYGNRGQDSERKRATDQSYYRYGENRDESPGPSEVESRSCSFEPNYEEPMDKGLQSYSPCESTDSSFFNSRKYSTDMARNLARLQEIEDKFGEKERIEEGCGREKRIEERERRQRMRPLYATCDVETNNYYQQKYRQDREEKQQYRRNSDQIRRTSQQKYQHNVDSKRNSEVIQYRHNSQRNTQAVQNRRNSQVNDNRKIIHVNLSRNDSQWNRNSGVIQGNPRGKRSGMKIVTSENVASLSNENDSKTAIVNHVKTMDDKCFSDRTVHTWSEHFRKVQEKLKSTLNGDCKSTQTTFRNTIKCVADSLVNGIKTVSNYIPEMNTIQDSAPCKRACPENIPPSISYTCSTPYEKCRRVKLQRSYNARVPCRYPSGASHRETLSPNSKPLEKKNTYVFVCEPTCLTQVLEKLDEKLESISGIIEVEIDNGYKQRVFEIDNGCGNGELECQKKVGYNGFDNQHRQLEYDSRHMNFDNQIDKRLLESFPRSASERRTQQLILNCMKNATAANNKNYDHPWNGHSRRDVGVCENVDQSLEYCDARVDNCGNVYKSLEQCNARVDNFENVYKSLEQCNARVDNCENVYKSLEHYNARVDNCENVYKSLEHCNARVGNTPSKAMRKNISKAREVKSRKLSGLNTMTRNGEIKIRLSGKRSRQGIKRFTKTPLIDL